MEKPDTSAVTLRISGDDLVPEEATRLLGASPTRTQTKGQVLVGGKTGTQRLAKGGMWTLEVADREPADLNAQIREVLSSLTDDLDVWRVLAGRYKVDLFCGFFLGTDGSGFSLSPQSLAALGERGIEIEMCVYSPVEDEFDSAPRPR